MGEAEMVSLEFERELDAGDHGSHEVGHSLGLTSESIHSLQISDAFGIAFDSLEHPVEQLCRCLLVHFGGFREITLVSFGDRIQMRREDAEPENEACGCPTSVFFVNLVGGFLFEFFSVVGLLHEFPDGFVISIDVDGDGLASLANRTPSAMRKCLRHSVFLLQLISLVHNLDEVLKRFFEFLEMFAREFCTNVSGVDSGSCHVSGQ